MLLMLLYIIAITFICHCSQHYHCYYCCCCYHYYHYYYHCYYYYNYLLHYKYYYKCKKKAPPMHVFFKGTKLEIKLHGLLVLSLPSHLTLFLIRVFFRKYWRFKGLHGKGGDHYDGEISSLTDSSVVLSHFL